MALRASAAELHSKLLTKDGGWFHYRIRAVGMHIQFWINDTPVMTYDDAEYKAGHFAIQGHSPGMKVDAKELYDMDRANRTAPPRASPIGPH